MGLYAGIDTRNHGYGRSMSHAGRQALQARYSGGHFGTVAAHSERWCAFAAWAKEQQNINDMRNVSVALVSQYAEAMRTQGLAVATMQNRISTINTIMKHAREGQWTSVSPREIVGESRTQVRTEAPASLDTARYSGAIAELRSAGLERAAAVFELARTLGLRSEEASKANLDRLQKEANALGRVNVQDGTKGGRDAPRWVPVTEAGRAALAAAVAARPQGSTNLLAQGETYKTWRSGELRAGREILHAHGIKGYHDARAAYACARYAALTGHRAPAVAGRRTASKADDSAARKTIAGELGHGRSDVARAYVGSSK